MRSRRNDSVLLLHGIRTHAAWQKALGDALSERGLVHDTYDYGRFGLSRFASARARRKQVDDFYNWYIDVRERKVPNPKLRHQFRPGVVAHSFGTYIVGHALNTFEDMNFGKIVFCGSILPRDFDWISIFGRNQVMEVRNDYGVDDIWSKTARLLVRDAGSSGASGFFISSPLVHDHRFQHFGHSDYFKRGHYEQWIQFFQEPLVRFRTVRSSELPAGMSWKDISPSTRGIDSLVYGPLDHYGDVAIPVGLSERWLGINPDIYTILVDQADRVHGYLNAMPLRTDVFDEVLSGARTDDKIEPGDIVTYTEGAEVDLYLMSIAIHPSSRRLGEGVDQSGLHRLVFGLTHRLEMLARERRILVKRLGAVGWTDEGRRMCELLVSMITQIRRNLDHVSSDPSRHHHRA
jgi:hypothetical protein